MGSFPSLVLARRPDACFALAPAAPRLDSWLLPRPGPRDVSFVEGIPSGSARANDEEEVRGMSTTGKAEVSGKDAAQTKNAEQPSGGSGHAEGTSGPAADPLAAALQSLFTSCADVVQGELQCSNNEYELLKDMNIRTAEEYDNFGDFASGLRLFVERLKLKNENFNRCLQEIDGIDRQVTELEALVSTLDSYTGTLQAQIRAAFPGG